MKKLLGNLMNIQSLDTKILLKYTLKKLKKEPLEEKESSGFNLAGFDLFKKNKKYLQN